MTQFKSTHRLHTKRMYPQGSVCRKVTLAMKSLHCILYTFISTNLTADSYEALYYILRIQNHKEIHWISGSWSLCSILRSQLGKSQTSLHIT